MPIGLTIGVFATLIVWVSAWYTRDQIPHLKKIKDDLPGFSIKQLLTEILLYFQNKNYLWLLLGLLCLAATNGVRETMSAYVNLFFCELEPNQLRYFGLTTPVAFIVAFIATPRLHSRFDKQRTMIGAVGVYAIATTLPIVLRMLGVFPGNDHPALFPLLATFVAVYYGAVAVLSITVLSALADVADDYELTTGRRQEGIFYSARTFVSKMTSGLGLLIGGIAIDVINWPTGVTSAASIDPDTLFKLALIDGPIAAIPPLFAIFFYGRHRINKRRYEEIHALLAARLAAE
jgi:Na+/melibiose symporter-like transporter